MLTTFDHLIGRDTNPILWWQMSLRATIIFFYAILLYRLVPRRAFGGTATPDFIVAVIIGSSLSRALTGNSPLLATIAATASLALLYTLLSVLSRRLSAISWLAKGRSIRLVRDGWIDREAMARAQIGDSDLFENLRLRGVDRIEDVAEARLERNGSISVVKTSGRERGGTLPAGHDPG